MSERFGHQGAVVLKIWGRLNSSNVQKVVWMADELGLAYERIDAGMAFGLNTTDAYKAMNPMGLVPVIDDDGFVLWESNAILRYLAAKHLSAGLMPSDLTSAARADQWTDWMCGAWYPAFGPAFMGLIRTPEAKRDMAAIEASVVKSDEMLAMLEARLASAPYLAGAEFSYADIAVGVFVNRWFKMGVGRTSYPAIAAWYQRLKSRSGSAQVFSIPVT
jgi:glutathione S-transferase